VPQLSPVLLPLPAVVVPEGLGGGASISNSIFS